jgi:hypothetical protein
MRAGPLPAINADRVQLRQVAMNLVLRRRPLTVILPTD